MPSATTIVAHAEADAKVGGKYRILMREQSGEEHGVLGTYREVTPNRRLVFTWAWRTTPERESLVTIDLKTVGKETELTLTHERFADVEVRDKHRVGWTGCLDSLVRHFASGAGANAA